MTTWSPPAELDQPLPRKVRLNPTYKLFLILLNAAFFGIAALVVFIAFLMCHKMASLKERGVYAEGNVTKRYSEVSKRTISYFVDYQFSVDIRSGGQKLYRIEKCPVPLPDFERLRVGAGVQIIYEPSRPDISVLSSTMNVFWADPYSRLRITAEIVALTFWPTLAVFVGPLGGLYVREKSSSNGAMLQRARSLIRKTPPSAHCVGTESGIDSRTTTARSLRESVCSSSDIVSSTDWLKLSSQKFGRGQPFCSTQRTVQRTCFIRQARLLWCRRGVADGLRQAHAKHGRVQIRKTFDIGCKMEGDGRAPQRGLRIHFRDVRQHVALGKVAVFLFTKV